MLHIFEHCGMFSGIVAYFGGIVTYLWHCNILGVCLVLGACLTFGCLPDIWVSAWYLGACLTFGCLPDMLWHCYILGHCYLFGALLHILALFLFRVCLTVFCAPDYTHLVMDGVMTVIANNAVVVTNFWMHLTGL